MDSTVRGRQKARQRDKEKQNITCQNLLFESTSACVRRGDVSSWTCALRCRNLVNVGTFVGVPVGTNWKTSLFLWGTKNNLKLHSCRWLFCRRHTMREHMHHFAKCKQRNEDSSHVDPSSLSINTFQCGKMIFCYLLLKIGKGGKDFDCCMNPADAEIC